MNSFNEEEQNARDILCSLKSSQNVCQSLSQNMVPKKRNKRHRKKKTLITDFLTSPPHGYILMPNADHRFKYPLRVIQHLLKGDFKAFKETMDDICAPDVVYKHHYDGAQNPYGPNKRTLVGTAAITELFTMMLLAGPDMVISLCGDVACHRLEATDESFIAFKILVSMTRIKVFKRIDSNQHEDKYATDKTEDESPHSSLETDADYTADNQANNSNKVAKSMLNGTPSALESITDQFKTFTLVPLKPKQAVQKTYHYGHMYWSLNAEHKITLFAYVFRYMSQSPIKKEKK